MCKTERERNEMTMKSRTETSEGCKCGGGGAHGARGLANSQRKKGPAAPFSLSISYSFLQPSMNLHLTINAMIIILSGGHALITDTSPQKPR